MPLLHMPSLHTHLLRSLVFALTMTLMIASSAAQGPNPAEVEAFQAHLARGGQLLEDESYESAINELEQARQIIDHPRISLSIAAAFRAWGRCQQAQAEYQRLAGVENLGDDNQERLDRGLERLDGCVEMAALTVSCESPDTALHIDEARVACPYRDELPVGTYAIRALREGYLDYHATASLEPGQTTALEIYMQPTALDPPDDEAPSIVTAIEQPPTEAGWTAYLGYASMAAGGLLIAAGAFSDHGAGDRTSQMLEAHLAADTGRLNELEGEADSARIRTIGLYAGGALLLGTGLVLHFTDFGRTDTTTASLALSTSGVSFTLRR
ncbi:MAG: hypothetical protein H0U74_00240 [Bradymonadaceae bacterium]|nr:hypothetical protein [Lujinxingiaceae bacterium]